MNLLKTLSVVVIDCYNAEFQEYNDNINVDINVNGNETLQKREQDD